MKSLAHVQIRDNIIFSKLLAMSKAFHFWKYSHITVTI